MEDTTGTRAFDAGDRRQVERREKTAKLAERRRAEDLRWLMGDARGRRFVWDLLGKAGIFRGSMGACAEQTAFNEGRRDIGLSTLAEVMDACPDQYARMQTEARSTQSPSNGDEDDGHDDANA